MKRALATFTLLACSPHAFAQGEASDDADRQALLALLDEQTAIATKTRMNADYVPGMVTVLHGRDLEARGSRTVWEALALVPGVELAIEPIGRRRLVIRGHGNISESGNVKILLNDVPMNSAYIGLADPVLNLPVAQVERIEVVRGPGSAIHGEYAYLGVINVITRTSGPRAFAFGGSFDTKGAGGVAAWESADGESRLSLNLAGWHTSGADSRSGPDDLYRMGYPEASYAPGEINEDLEAGAAVLRYEHRDFSLTAQWAQDAFGDHLGGNLVLPPDPDQLVERHRHRAVELRQGVPLDEGVRAQLLVGWQDMQQERDGFFLGPPENFPGTTGGPDVYGDSLYRERRFYGGVDFSGKAGRHGWLVGLESADVEMDAARSQANLACSGPTACTALPDPVPWPVAAPVGTRRTIQSATLQDEFRLDDRFTLTAGARYDRFSDAGSRTSPRLAGVWRATPRHIFKAQYAEAFRPPTLFENGVTAGRLKPALTRSREVGYIYQGDRAVTRLTAFHTRLDDLVAFYYVPAASGYRNEDADLRGVEWEQSLRLTPHTTVEGNLSYVETEDDATGEPIAGSVPWLANAAIIHEVNERFRWALQAHYASGFKRETFDPRNDLHGYTTVDLTASLFHLGAKGLTLRLGVKNLFDADVRFPVTAPERTPSYPDDHPQPGRSAWVQLSYDP